MTFFIWPILTPGYISSSYTNAIGVPLFEHLFSERAANIWNRLPVSIVDFSSLHHFRNSFDTLDVNELADAYKL